MNYTIWQIDKLRRGLHAYRLLMAVNGKLRPWKLAIDDIISSPATSREYSTRLRGKSDFKEEALRRFAEGENLLEATKLDDVARFLVAARVVSAEELADGSDVVSDNLLLQRFFASGTEQVSSRLAQLSTDYQGEQRAGDRSQELWLRLAPQPLSGFVLVEERARTTARDGAASRYDRKDDNIVGSTVRKGCALITSRYPTLHIFVRGSGTDDFIHYVRVGTDGMQKLDQLLLVRSGAATPEIAGHVEGDDLLARYNIVRFKPTTSRPVLPSDKPRRGKSRTKVLVKGKAVSL